MYNHLIFYPAKRRVYGPIRGVKIRYILYKNNKQLKKKATQHKKKMSEPDTTTPAQEETTTTTTTTATPAPEETTTAPTEAPTTTTETPDATEAAAEPKEATEGEAAPAAPKKDNQWGAWGEEASAELIDIAATEKCERGNALLDELAVMDKTEEDLEKITGPDGYEYPPLTKGGIDILKRMWAGELPENRQESVKLWEKKVRCAVSVGLAIPVPPRVPATEILNRPAAAIKETDTEKDLSKWVVPEMDTENMSDELKEFHEKGIVAETVTSMLDRRLEARTQRNFQEADQLRNDLFEMGVEFNDAEMKWRSADGASGSFGKNFVGMAHHNNNEGGNMQAEDATRPPPEVQDIDLPASWTDFLALPEPKVLAVGPRSHHTGKRAWGAGGYNWGTHDVSAAAEQAMQNCIQQGVHRPKIIWPLHLAGQGGKVCICKYTVLLVSNLSLSKHKNREEEREVSGAEEAVVRATEGREEATTGTEKVEKKRIPLINQDVFSFQVTITKKKKKATAIKKKTGVGIYFVSKKKCVESGRLHDCGNT